MLAQCHGNTKLQTLYSVKAQADDEYCPLLSFIYIGDLTSTAIRGIMAPERQARAAFLYGAFTTSCNSIASSFIDSG